MESEGKFRFSELTSTVLLAAVAVGITTTTALLEARCLHSYRHGKSPGAHSSTEAIVLAKAAKAFS